MVDRLTQAIKPALPLGCGYRMACRVRLGIICEPGELNVIPNPFWQVRNVKSEKQKIIFLDSGNGHMSRVACFWQSIHTQITTLRRHRYTHQTHIYTHTNFLKKTYLQAANHSNKPWLAHVRQRSTSNHPLRTFGALPATRNRNSEANPKSFIPKSETPTWTSKVPKRMIESKGSRGSSNPEPRLEPRSRPRGPEPSREGRRREQYGLGYLGTCRASSYNPGGLGWVGGSKAPNESRVRIASLLGPTRVYLFWPSWSLPPF